ncbi:MAG: hypothetical protein A2Z75_04480 [Chloroflexi bacterium RBG_13_50_10]|nr:MAG: hypothetical protein A2Z75_04480 [Chloroflexi bacterium RBG_13_50_10]
MTVFVYCEKGGVIVKLTGLVAKVVKADAEYFYKNDFIPAQKYHSVLSWLDTGDDCEAQLTAATWLESDAQYFKELAWALVVHHWYMAPLMMAMVYFVPKALLKRVAKLRNDCP